MQQSSKNYSIIKVSSIFFWLIRTSHINYFFFFKKKEASMLIHQLEGGVCALHLNFCIVLNIRKPNSRLVIRNIQCTRFDLITCHLFWNFSCHSNWQKNVLGIHDNLLYIKLNINTEQTSVISVINPKIYPEMRHCLFDNFIDVEWLRFV